MSNKKDTSKRGKKLHSVASMGYDCLVISVLQKNTPLINLEPIVFSRLHLNTMALHEQSLLLKTSKDQGKIKDESISVIRDGQTYCTSPFEAH